MSQDRRRGEVTTYNVGLQHERHDKRSGGFLEAVEQYCRTTPGTEEAVEALAHIVGTGRRGTVNLKWLGIV